MRDDVAHLAALDGVVADGGGGGEMASSISPDSRNWLLLLTVVGPDAGEEVGLKLEADGVAGCIPPGSSTAQRALDLIR